VSQWAEIRQMHLVDEVPKKEIARRLGVNIKTVRRAVELEAFPKRRASPRRGRRLDVCREEIVALLRLEPRRVRRANPSSDRGAPVQSGLTPTSGPGTSG